MAGNDPKTVKLDGDASTLLKALTDTHLAAKTAGDSVNQLKANLAALQTQMHGVSSSNDKQRSQLVKMAQELKALIGQGGLFDNALQAGLERAVSSGIRAGFKSLSGSLFQDFAKGLSNAVQGEMSRNSFKQALANPAVQGLLSSSNSSYTGRLAAIGSTRDLEKLRALETAEQARAGQASQNGDSRSQAVHVANLARIQERINAIKAETKALEERQAVQDKEFTKAQQGQAAVAGRIMGYKETARLAREEAKLLADINERKSLAANIRGTKADLSAANLIGDPATITQTTDKLKQLLIAMEQLQRAKKASASTPGGMASGVDPQYVDRRFQAASAWLGHEGGSAAFGVQLHLMANYRLMDAFMSALSSGPRFVKEFEAELKNLQAITGATNAETNQLGETFLKVAKNSKFSGIEVAKAGTIMAQAGMSQQEIGGAIKGVLQLATATGTELKTAVDIATSVIGAFNMQASQMGVVSNMVSAALNVSKLDAEKFALGLQYAGNVAAETGVSLGDMTTALATMANTGIKSGSTLGTGLRQIMEALSAPNEKLEKVFSRLGLTMEDVNIRSRGLFGVLKTMRDAGFTTADAVEVFGVRTASAMSSMFNSLDKVDDMRRAIVSGGDSAKAAATQMDSLAGALAKFANTGLELVFKSSGGLVEMFKGLLSTGTSLMGFLGNFSNLISGGLIVAFSALTAKTGVWLAQLAYGAVVQLTNGLLNVAAGFKAITVATDAATAASIRMSRANLWVAAFTVAIATLGFVWDSTADKQKKAKEEAEKLDTQLNEEKGRLDKHTQAVSTLNTEIDKLLNQYGDLSKEGADLNPVIAELNNNFRSMGLFVQQGTTNVDGLIQKLRELSVEEARRAGEAAQRQQTLLKQKLDNEREQIKGLGSTFIDRVASNESFSRGDINSTGASGPSLRARLVPEFNPQLHGAKGEKLLAEMFQTLGWMRGGVTADENGSYAAASTAITHRMARLGDLSSQEGVSQQLRDQTQVVISELNDWASKLEGTTSITAQMGIAMKTKLEKEFFNQPVAQQFVERTTDSRKKFAEIGKAYTTGSNSAPISERLKGEADALTMFISELDAQEKLLEDRFPAKDGPLQDYGYWTSLRNVRIQAEKKEKELREAYAKRMKEGGASALNSIEAEARRLQVEGKTPQLNVQAQRQVNDQLRTQAEEARKQRLINLGIESETWNKKDPNTSTRIATERKTIQTDYASKIQELDNQLAEMQRSVTSKAIGTLKAELFGINRDMQNSLKKVESGNLSKADREAALKDYEESSKQAFELQKRISEVEASNADNREQAALKLLEELENAQIAFEGRSFKASELRQLLKGVTAAWASLMAGVKEKLEEAEQKFKEAEVNAFKPVSAGYQEVYSAQGRFNSDPTAFYDMAAAERELRQKLLPAQAEARLGALHEKESTLTGLLPDVRSGVAEHKKVYEGLDPTSENSNKAKTRYLEALREQHNLEGMISDTQKQQLETQGTLAKLKAESDPQTLGDAFKGGWNNWATAEGLGKPMLTMFRDSLPQAFSAAKNGFATFTADVLSRTKSVGEAFKNLAKTVLEAMANIAMNQAAAGLFGLAIKGVTMAASAYFGSGSEGFTTDSAQIGAGYQGTTMAGSNQWAGGPILRRAAAGYGPVRTRDSVPILAAPGEFIMRQSAVDLIGADNLSAMNAMGNRRASQSPMNDNRRKEGNEGIGVVNVWVVAPDEKPQMGPKDVIAHITDDMRRGGVTKQLVKSIVSGAV